MQSSASPSVETAGKSPLNKPLSQLTEDDISQLTREDCRRYLKGKGMRRPSWNKSQAIQQVIMLKRLLEPMPDSEAGRRKKFLVPSSNNVSSENNKDHEADNPCAPEGTYGYAKDSESADETLRKNAEKSDFSGDVSGYSPAPNHGSTPPRTTCSMYIPAGQMTIFYCGKVNVYDDVPADKARALMHMAASPLQFSQESPFDVSVTVSPSICHSQAVSGKLFPDYVLSPIMHTAKTSDTSRLHGEESIMLLADNTAESPSARKASVQRYLEKRKDRLKALEKVN